MNRLAERAAPAELESEQDAVMDDMTSLDNEIDDLLDQADAEVEVETKPKAKAKKVLLTRDQERELAQRIEAGRQAKLDLAETDDPKLRLKLEATISDGQRAWDHFFESNLPLVISIARRYSYDGLDLDDHIQDGNIGLMRALEKFDWRRGTKFSTVATPWIRQAITRAIMMTARPIRVAENFASTIQQVRRVQTQLALKRGIEPTHQDIAKELNLSVKVVADALETHWATITTSLDVKLGEDSSADRYNQLGATPSHEHAVLDRVGYELGRKKLNQLLELHLDERAIAVIRAHYGLDGGQGKSFREIASDFGMTTEGISKIKVRAFNHLYAQVAKELTECLELIASGPVAHAGTPWVKQRRYNKLRRPMPKGPQRAVLQLLVEAGGTLEHENLPPYLAELTTCTVKQIRTCVVQMEETGYIVRETHSGKRASNIRPFRITITDKGRDALVR